MRERTWKLESAEQTKRNQTKSCELFAMHGSFQGQVVLDSAGAGIEALRRAKL
jgi:hypothetical protein